MKCKLCMNVNTKKQNVLENGYSSIEVSAPGETLQSSRRFT